jgi:peptidoglycan-N-acetylglucosamine deacetylase
LIWLLVVVIAGGAVAMVASATSTPLTSSGISTTPPAADRAPTSSRPDPRAAARAAVRQENRVIDGVLAYTPFVRAGLPRQRMIALTFDDGPSPYTPQIVRVLVRLHVPATFFVVGQQLRYFSAGLRDELRHGFVVGDHTENHPPLNLMGEALQYGQIHTAGLQIRHLGGLFPRLFRPPYGLYDAHTLAILRRLHMLMVMWSVDPQDWLRPGTKVIVQRVLQAARPGTIVEMHDGGGDRSQTVAALPAIVAALRRRHYELVTVPQLLAADPPPRQQPMPHLSE